MKKEDRAGRNTGRSWIRCIIRINGRFGSKKSQRIFWKELFEISEILRERNWKENKVAKGDAIRKFVLEYRRYEILKIQSFWGKLKVIKKKIIYERSNIWKRINRLHFRKFSEVFASTIFWMRSFTSSWK